jgi:hypothetical protein
MEAAMKQLSQYMLIAVVMVSPYGLACATNEPARENQSAVAAVESGGSLPQSVAVNVHLQANANQHKVWPGSETTWHYGTGYIELRISPQAGPPISRHVGPVISPDAGPSFHACRSTC